MTTIKFRPQRGSKPQWPPPEFQEFRRFFENCWCCFQNFLEVPLQRHKISIDKWLKNNNSFIEHQQLSSQAKWMMNHWKLTRVCHINGGRNKDHWSVFRHSFRVRRSLELYSVFFKGLVSLNFSDLTLFHEYMSIILKGLNYVFGRRELNIKLFGSLGHRDLIVDNFFNQFYSSLAWR